METFTAVIPIPSDFDIDNGELPTDFPGAPPGPPTRWEIIEKGAVTDAAGEVLLNLEDHGMLVLKYIWEVA